MIPEGARDRVQAAIDSVTYELQAARARIGATESWLDGRTQADVRRGALGNIDDIEARDVPRLVKRGAALAVESTERELADFEAVAADLVAVLDAHATYTEEAGIGRVVWQTVTATLAELRSHASDAIDGLKKNASAVRIGIVFAFVTGAAVVAAVILKRTGVTK